MWRAILAGVIPAALSATARAGADPLPARLVERPVVLPRGWLETGLAWRHGLSPAAPDDTTRAYVALGVGRVELRTGWGASWRAPIVPGAVAVDLRWSVLRREPPNRSVALRAMLELPTRADDPALAAWGVVARVGAGPTAWTVDAWWGLGRSLGGAAGPVVTPVARVDVDGMLQAGPLVLVARAGASRRVEGTTSIRAEGGLVVQATRGVDVEVAGGAAVSLGAGTYAPGWRPWVGAALRVRAPALAPSP
ncbi:MAG: hypothetical protein H6733_02440 [Alphaproteobacteria bacterium]|nr:hypothetical protein [Alphaproteobacteria bacterium]